MGSGNLRNNSCWCGSGKKLKKCHLNRVNETSQPLWKSDKLFKKSFSAKYCSVPDPFKEHCDGNIIRAHTVAKSGSLKKIAREGHVYAYKPSLQNLRKNNGKLEPQLVGINNASTFTGFCGYHDRELFAPIETVPFIGSSEQCFLLGYRSTCREHYTKYAASETAPIIAQADAGKPFMAQRDIQMMAALYAEGNELGRKDSDRIKSKFDETLTTQAYEKESRAVVFKFENPCDVMCSGSWFPTNNLEGKQLQNLQDAAELMRPISMTSFASEEKGYVVFQWLTEDSTVAENFMQSVIKLGEKQFSELFLKLMIRQFENIHIRPEWWEALSGEQKEYLGSLMGDILGSKDIFATGTPKFELSWNIQEYYPVGFEFN